MLIGDTMGIETLTRLALRLAQVSDWGRGYAGNAGGEPGLVFVADDMRFKPAGAMVCGHCGAEDRPVLGPGSAGGVHKASALCRHCGGFLKWVSMKTADERQAQRL